MTHPPNRDIPAEVDKFISQIPSEPDGYYDAEDSSNEEIDLSFLDE